MRLAVGWPCVNTIELVKRQIREFSEHVVGAEHSPWDGIDLIAVDNGSTDGSDWYLKRAEGVSEILNQSNTGFTHAANQILTSATSVGADWVLLHNTDAFIDSDITAAMLDTALRNERVGIVGPKVLDYEDDNRRGDRCTIQCAGDLLMRPYPRDQYVRVETPIAGTPFVIDETTTPFRVHTTARTGHEDHDDFNREEQVEFYTFVSVLISMEMVRDIGPLDESMVNYGSDTEFCLRARQNGWAIWYQPSARVWHMGSASSHSQQSEQTIADFRLLDGVMSDTIVT